MATAPTSWFDGRLKFQDEAFGKYVAAFPATKTLNFMKSGIVAQDGTLTQYFSQGGSYSQRIPIQGSAEAEEENYDGETPMGDPAYQDTYSAANIAYGRQFALAEKDFSFDLIPGAPFEAVLRKAIVTTKDNAFEKRLFGITKALFETAETEIPPETEGDDPTYEANPESTFAAKHTYDISAETGDKSKIGETTLNNAIQQAAGEFKSDFTMVAMHSQVATNLENLKLLNYAKGVDENGVVKDLGFATWNGKTVVIDDAMPYDSTTGKYTSYIFGRGCFGYCNIPVKVPYEPVRDSDYGIDKMYIRYREVLMPRGWSFEGATAKMSPTDAELFTATNWKLADNGKKGDDRKVYPISRIPLARIISLG